jgi:hypothetical protein
VIPVVGRKEYVAQAARPCEAGTYGTAARITASKRGNTKTSSWDYSAPVNNPCA